MYLDVGYRYPDVRYRCLDVEYRCPDVRYHIRHLISILDVGYDIIAPVSFCHKL